MIRIEVAQITSLTKVISYVACDFTHSLLTKTSFRDSRGEAVVISGSSNKIARLRDISRNAFHDLSQDSFQNASRRYFRRISSGIFRILAFFSEFLHDNHSEFLISPAVFHPAGFFSQIYCSLRLS